MVHSDLTTTEILSQKSLANWHSQHPRAYARERNARSDGMGYRAEWIVVDPDMGYMTVGIGATEMEAWRNAVQKGTKEKSTRGT